VRPASLGAARAAATLPRCSRGTQGRNGVCGGSRGRRNGLAQGVLGPICAIAHRPSLQTLCESETLSLQAGRFKRLYSLWSVTCLYPVYKYRSPICKTGRVSQPSRSRGESVKNKNREAGFTVESYECAAAAHCHWRTAACGLWRAARCARGARRPAPGARRPPAPAGLLPLTAGRGHGRGGARACAGEAGAPRCVGDAITIHEHT